MSQTHARTATALVVVGLMLVAGTVPVVASGTTADESNIAADRFDLVDSWWNKDVERTAQDQTDTQQDTRTVSVTEPDETGSYGVTVTELTVPESVADDEAIPVEVEIANVHGEEEISVATVRISPAGSDGVLYSQGQSYSLAENGASASESYRIGADTLPPGEYTISVHTIKNGEVGSVPLQIVDST